VGSDDSSQESDTSEASAREESGTGGTAESAETSEAADASGGDTGDQESSDAGSTGDGTTDGPPDCPNETVLPEYEKTAVEVVCDCDQLGSVTAAVADTTTKQVTGLSEVDCLPEDRGMVFVYGSSSPRNFWMRDMDIAIHHAEKPAPDESGTEGYHQYPGRGKYVLEVPYGWTKRHGVDVNASVRFEL
jgi:uncharacterized membrane protein (UPF0127 family)